jgi:hypothetical protein
MNERIKELMIQADYPAPELALRAHRLTELIIQECTETCLRMQLGNQYTPEEMLFQTKYRNLIKEHFGVSND